MLQNNLVFALPANLNEPAKSGTARIVEEILCNLEQ
jgi:hypothetical protein